MNLIEQLGGYDAAKNLLGGVSNNKSPNEILNRELLEYRRQHNIYEVGDKVVWINSIAPGDPRIFEVEGGLGEKPDTWSLRHATDKEIKAGKRLEAP